MRAYSLTLVALVGTSVSWWLAMSTQGGTWTARGVLVGGLAATWTLSYACSADRALALEMHRPKAGDPTKGIASAMLVGAMLWACVKFGWLKSLVPQFQYVAATLRVVGIENAEPSGLALAAQGLCLAAYALAFEGIWRGFVLLSLESQCGSRKAEVMAAVLSVLAVVPAALVLSPSGHLIAFGAFWPLVHAVAALCSVVLVRISGRLVPGAIALGMVLVLVLSPARQSLSRAESVSQD